MQFQNGFNKVVTELSGVQVWSEIILVLSNWTRAARSFVFEITHMISDQIAVHLVQSPLMSSVTYLFYRIFLIRHHYKHVFAHHLRTSNMLCQFNVSLSIFSLSRQFLFLPDMAKSDQINLHLRASEYRIQWRCNLSQYRSSFTGTVTFSFYHVLCWY